MTEKVIKGIIIVNWKSGTIKAVKRRQNKTSNYEIPINFTLTVQEPVIKVNEINASIKIPEAKFKAAFMDNFIEDERVK